MQGSSDPRAQISFAAHQKTTPIYGEPERPLGSNFMDSLSLRRDLLSPENPPFGMWWTYTVEEALVWPILEFDGEINSGLDAVLDLPDEDEGESSSEAGHGFGHGFGRPPAARNHVGRIRKGLDDGDTVHEFIESFLRNVHIQNPVLDPAKLQTYVSNFIENGLGWDGETCQVVSHLFPGPVPHSDVGSCLLVRLVRYHTLGTFLNYRIFLVRFPIRRDLAWDESILMLLKNASGHFGHVHPWSQLSVFS